MVEPPARIAAKGRQAVVYLAIGMSTLGTAVEILDQERTGRWSGYDELDTRLRAKGVQDDPKKKAIRQAVQGLGGEGGPVRGK